MKKGHWFRGRSFLSLDIIIKKEFLEDYFMTQRDRRRYWKDYKSCLYGPTGSFSKWLIIKKNMQYEKRIKMVNR